MMFAVAILSICATTAIVAGTSSAFQGSDETMPQNNTQSEGNQFGVKKNFRKNNFDPERHRQMIEIFENKDYEAWKELMGDNKITEIITAENFDQFVQAHQLMQQAHDIFEELGLPGKGEMKGFGMGMHR